MDSSGGPYKENWSKKVYHEKSAEVIVLLEIVGRTEQFTVFKYTKIMLIMSQNKYREKYKTYLGKEPQKV